jgi:ribosome biogenesis GTPase / thiamine phosphate phosphatase
LVKDTNGRVWQGRIKGKFKIDDAITSTNPLAVGDVVTVEIENEKENTVTIIGIDDRRNYIVRLSPHNKNLQHIIASNLDQACLIASIKSPKTSMGFIDRFLVMAELHGVVPIIIINKIDLLKDKDVATLNKYTNIYTSIGYTVMHTNANTKQSIQALQTILSNKTSLLTGHSGVGKSTIINGIFPELDIRTTEVSSWSSKGMHTTTFAEMHDIDEHTAIIDTPGIRELGIINVDKYELGGYFVEIKKYMNQCKFNNCLHLNEPNCGIHNAIQAGQISIHRYESYLAIMATLQV